MQTAGVDAASHNTTKVPYTMTRSSQAANSSADSHRTVPSLTRPLNSKKGSPRLVFHRMR